MSVGKISENKAFTLLELLIVMVIISMVFAFVGPRLADSLTKLNSKTAAKKIAACLRYARSRAVSEKTRYVCEFDFEKNRLVIAKPRLGSPEPQTPNPEPAPAYNLPEGVRFKAAEGDKIESDGVFQIVFYPVGNSSGGEIIVSDEDERAFKIQADLITGTVQLSEL